MDTTVQLSRDLYYLVVDALRGAVPAPASKSPDDIARRDNALIAAVASLRPANADQVLLAAQYVAASLRSLDRIEEAHEDTPWPIPPKPRSSAISAACQRNSMIRPRRPAS